MVNISSKPVLSLRHFILKQEVKQLYRQILRTIKEVEDHSQRKELQEWARSEFRANAHHSDEVAIRMYIKYGQRSLKQLETTIGLSK